MADTHDVDDEVVRWLNELRAENPNITAAEITAKWEERRGVLEAEVVLAQADLDEYDEIMALLRPYWSPDETMGQAVDRMQNAHDPHFARVKDWSDRHPYIAVPRR